MAIITWDESLSVKVGLFDSQHKKLIALINSLNEAMREGKGKDVLQTIINELASYTNIHFRAEENYFKKYGYQETAQHMAEHKKFVDEVDKFKRDFESGNIGLSVKILTFLSNWLRDHIMGTDKRYVEFFHKHGIS